MDNETLRRWLAQQAAPVPLAGDTAQTLVDTTAGAAEIVGLGAAVRHAAGSVAAMRAILDDLVAHHGFRSLVLEGTETPYATAEPLDRFVVHGEGDPHALVAASQEFLRTREILDLLLTLRTRNQAYPDDPVRIAHSADDTPYSAELVRLEHELAERVLTWRDQVGGRSVYWGGAAHVLAGDPRGIGVAGPEQTHRNAGGHLRSALGAGYVSVACTVGSVDAGLGHPAIPAPPSSFIETALSDLPHAAWVPLHDADAPPEVAAWLDAPLRTRMIGPAYDPQRDPDHHIWAPTVRGSVDAILHVPHSSTDTALTP